MKKILLILLIITGVASMAAAYTYYIYIPEKVERQIINSLNGLGFEKFSFASVERKNGRIIFHDISLDNKNLSTIGELQVKTSLVQFLLDNTRAQKIIIKDLNITGEISKDFVITISGWNKGAKALNKFQNIPTSMIVIEKSKIELLSETLGGISVKYNAQIGLSNSGEISIKALMSSKQKRLKFQSKINGTLSKNGELSITADTDQIALTQQNLNIRRGSGVFNIFHAINSNKSSLSAELDFSSINWQKLPLRDVHLAIKNNTITAKGRTFGNENIAWSTKINKEKDIYHAQSVITPDNFAGLISFLQFNKRLTKDVNFPGFILNSEKPNIFINTAINKDNIIDGIFKFANSYPVFEIDGKFRSDQEKKYIKGGFSASKSNISSTGNSIDNWMNFDVTTSGKFIIRNIAKLAKLDWYVISKVNEGNIKFGDIELKNIAETFSYSSNKPKKTKAHLAFRLPLKPRIKQSGKIVLNILDRKKPLFKTLSVDLYGGNIRTERAISNGGAVIKDNKLIISDINLSSLFHDANFGEIYVSGQLGGIIPYIMNNKEIKANGGILQSQKSGIIRLPENIILDLFSGNSGEMLLIRKALKNYHYEFFEIRLDGDLSDRVMVSLNAKGYNPDMKNKPSVDINLQIETQISQLLKNILR